MATPIWPVPCGHRFGAARRFVVAAGLLIALGLVACTGGGAPGVPPDLEAFTDHLDRRVVELMRQDGVPGVAVALIDRGEPVWSAAYGLADLETGRPMTVHTIDRAESISKSVTAWGVMTLVEGSRLDLDDPVARYVGDWAFPDSDFSPDDITVRHLLTHTSGMPLGTVGVHYPPGSAMPTLRENLTAQAVLAQEPGTFVYSNVGFNLLELVVEEVSGESFAEYLDREVLDPLGMTSATFEWSPGIAPPVPDGHDLGGRAIPVYVYPEKGSGGLLANVDDIARFVAAEVTAGGGALSSASVEQLHDPAVDIGGIFRFVSESYGLGHFVEELPTGERAVWHGGQGSGWMTHFHAVPEAGAGIVILTNSQRSWPMISSILSDWAEWNGFGPVGMGIIADAVPYLWGVIAVIVALSVWLAWLLASGFWSGRRRIAPFEADRRVVRAIACLGAVALFATLLWAATRDYLFVTSVFPAASPWLGAALFALAVVLLVAAVSTQTTKERARR